MDNGEVTITFWDKLKLLMWLRSLPKEVNKMDKIKGLLSKVDGLKSVTGLLVVVAYYAVPSFGGPHLPDVVLKIGMSLAGVGLAAKLEKGTAVVSKVLVVAHKIIDGLQAVVDALAPKPEAPKA